MPKISFLTVMHVHWLFALFVLFPFNHSLAQGKGYVVPEGSTVLDAEVDYSFVQPGDTLYLSGRSDFLLINHFKGKAGKPIVICNKPGEIFRVDNDFVYAVSIRDVRHFVFESTLVNGEKGIQLANSGGYGLDIGYLSSHYRLSHLDIGPIALGPGILAKTDPNCDFNSTRDKFLQDSTTISHCYIHDTDTEGIYLGNVFQNGVQLRCNRNDTLVFPHLVKNAVVEDNILLRCGWDAIQLSGTPDAIVRNNFIESDSQSKMEFQSNGIILGDGFSGIAHNNSIINGNGSGIFVKGLGEIIIENNLVINPGHNNKGNSGRYGLYVDLRDPQAERVLVSHNVFANARGEAIRYISDLNNNSAISNNFITYNDSLNAPIDDYINLVNQEPKELEKNIILSDKQAQNLFWESDSLDQKTNAPTAGQASLSGRTMNVDFYYRQRPKEIGKIDVGPFQSGIGTGVIDSTNENICGLQNNERVLIFDTQFKKVFEGFYQDYTSIRSGIYVVYGIENKCFRKIWIP